MTKKNSLVIRELTNTNLITHKVDTVAENTTIPTCSNAKRVTRMNYNESPTAKKPEAKTPVN